MRLSLTNLVYVLFDPVIPTSSFQFYSIVSILVLYITKNIFQTIIFLM